jgi:hypothetical protein
MGSLGAVQLAGGVAGNLERWRKLSLTFEDSQLQQDGIWLCLPKARRLRKFGFQDRNVSELAATDRPDVGCGFELTHLSYQLADT